MRVANFWLDDYFCKFCLCGATAHNGFIRVEHRAKCPRVVSMKRDYPRLMKILERQRANG